MGNKTKSPYATWSKEEESLLLGLIGIKPRQLIIDDHKRMVREKREGFTSRSRDAILDRICVLSRRHDLSTRTVHDYWTFCELARVLDVSPMRVRVWVSHGLTPHRPTWHHAISRLSLRRWARNSPANAARMSDLERDRLIYVFDDIELVDWILDHKPTTKKAIPIRCVETGKVYADMGEAGKAYHLARTTVSRAVRLGSLSGGVHFERVQ